MPLFKSIFEYHPTVNTIECFSLGLDLRAVFFFPSQLRFLTILASAHLGISIATPSRPSPAARLTGSGVARLQVEGSLGAARLHAFPPAQLGPHA